MPDLRPFAVVTGASSGIGCKLARLFVDEAMKKGEGDVIAGFKNKLQAVVAAVTSRGVLAEMHRGMAEPGSGKD